MTAAIAACSNDVRIIPEPTGTTATTTTTSSSTSGTMGGAGGSGGASTSSSGGTTKLTTADTDMAQCQSITATGDATATAVKVLEGPFFVTDVLAGSTSAPTFTTVAGTDCSVPQDKHTFVLQVVPLPGAGSGTSPQVHGIRLPVLTGQSLCAFSGLSLGVTTTVLGFKPY